MGKLTHENLASLLKNWSELNTNYRMRLKPILSDTDCISLAEYLLVGHEFVEKLYPEPGAADDPDRGPQA